jgi:hypothetical protein
LISALSACCAIAIPVVAIPAGHPLLQFGVASPTRLALGSVTLRRDPSIPLHFTLGDGAALAVPELRGAEIRSLVSDDFDEDGIPDLACGVATPGGGMVSVYRGSLAAIFPNSPRVPAGDSGGSPFVGPALSVQVGNEPDFIVAGDFDNDRHRDVMIGTRGDNRISLLSGRGDGLFAPSTVLTLPGSLTALAAGDVNRPDGLVDVVATVAQNTRGSLVVFEGPYGAIAAPPEVTALPAAPACLAIGHLAGPLSADIAVGAGPDLVVVHGRDRKLIAGPENAPYLGPPVVTVTHMGAHIVSLATGDFTGDHRCDLAALTESGNVELLEHTGPFKAGGLAPAPALWRAAATGSDGGSIIGARLSTTRHETVAWLDRAGSRVVVLSGDGSAVYESDAEPVAAIPMRLDNDALDDLVIAQAGRSTPSVARTLRSHELYVTSSADSGPGTLRQAIRDANEAPGINEIQFAVGSGPVTIQVESPLPEITDPVVINGTTQPGYAGVAIVTLDGQNVLGESGLYVTSGASCIMGLSIIRFRTDEANDNYYGFAVYFYGAGGNIVQNCLIGIDQDSAEDLGNQAGIWLIQSPGNLIGGAVLEARNVISGNGGHGVGIFEASTDTVVQGNFIGTDLTGTLPRGNYVGVGNDNVARNVVGGTAPGTGNIIGASGSYNVDIISTDAAENLVQGNFSGTDSTGTAILGGSTGVGICGGANNGAKANLVGGTAAGASNTIAYCWDGVAIGTAPNVDSYWNRILCNTIYGNLNLGIDLSEDYTSDNDPGDADTGPNYQLNRPVVDSFAIDGQNATINGHLDSNPNTSFRVEFYTGNQSGGSGFGQGRTFLGFQNVTTGGDGTVSFTHTASSAGINPDDYITAIATDTDGNTSEFSLSIEVKLAWEEPDFASGELNPPPRNLVARLPDSGKSRKGDWRPGTFCEDLQSARGPSYQGLLGPRWRERYAQAAELTKGRRPSGPGTFLGYNVYRSDSPDFTPSLQNLVRSLAAAAEINSYVFQQGSYYKVTAVYTTGESSPTSFAAAAVPPILATAVVTKKKITATGARLDGVPFALFDNNYYNVKVKNGGTTLILKGGIYGRSFTKYIGERGGSAILVVRGENAGLAILRVTL